METHNFTFALNNIIVCSIDEPLDQDKYFKNLLRDFLQQ